MQRLILFWVVTTLCGCSIWLGSPVNKQVASPPLQSCADKPSKELVILEVENITQQVFKKSGTVPAKHIWGYKFHGNGTQTLSVKSSKNLCLWLYSPFLDRLTITAKEAIALSKRGNYILHVQENQGISNYTLEVGIVSPAPKNTQDFSQDEAVKLVNEWLSAKSKILAPPYDRNLAKQITTGVLYQDLVQPNGKIDLLQNKGESYSYKVSKVTKFISFTNNEKKQPILMVEVTEHLIYRRKPEVLLAPPQKTYAVMYFFAKEREFWKLADYKLNN
jgi:hypothetical protein